MRRRRALPALLLAVVASTPVARAAAPEGAVPGWRDYRLGQFISSRGRMPSDVVALDNNGEILLACRDGCSAASLASAGVAALDSQLELLRTWSLLAPTEGGYRTAIPILDGDRAAELTELADRAAAKIVDATAAEVRELIAALDTAGWGSHGWTVMFSYVLDGLVWEFFDELGRIAPRNVSRGGAPWGGEVWLHPGGDPPGTSSLRRRSTTVKMSWVEALRPHVAAVLGRPHGLPALLDSLEKGEPAADEVRAHLREYGVVGDDGLTVPVIRVSPEDPIYRLCEGLTERIVETVGARLQPAALVNDFGFASESQALIVTYHHVMWRVIERLAAAGLVATPASIADPATAHPGDVGELVVWIQQSKTAAGDTAPGQDRD